MSWASSLLRAITARGRLNQLSRQRYRYLRMQLMTTPTHYRTPYVPVITELPYGPDVYYQFGVLNQTATYWLGNLAEGNFERIQEDCMPPRAEICEMREAHCQWLTCLFDGVATNAFNIKLAQRQTARAMSWAGEHPIRVKYVEELRDLLATLETYQDSTSNPGTCVKLAPIDSAAFTLSAPDTSST